MGFGSHTTIVMQKIRYLSDGLKSDLELRALIEENISKRDGVPLPIESRMLGSIEKCISASGLAIEEIKAAKKIPPLSERLKTVGGTPLQYVVQMRMASHAVHGTWTGLLSQYLETDDGLDFRPKDAIVRTIAAQMVMNCTVSIDLLQSWLR